MTSFDEWLSRRISGADALSFNAVVVSVAPRVTLGAMDLLRAWWEHLSKLQADLSLPSGDRSVWGAHDYIAALSIRDHFATAVAHMDLIQKGHIEPIIAEIDQRFVEFTEPDDDGCTERVDGRRAAERGWWWSRVPARGPVRAELEAHYGHGT